MVVAVGLADDYELVLVHTGFENLAWYPVPGADE